MTQKNGKLIEIILGDDKLTEKEKRKYEAMASLYLSDFTNNISKSSLQLSSLYSSYNADDWMEWQSYPSISKYINRFRQESMLRQNDTSLLAGDSSGAVSVRKLLDKNSAEANLRFVVFRLPDRKKDG